MSNAAERVILVFEGARDHRRLSADLTGSLLLLIAAGAIAVLLFPIRKLCIHAFIALILISLAAAFTTGIRTSQTLTVLIGSFGSTFMGSRC